MCKIRILFVLSQLAVLAFATFQNEIVPSCSPDVKICEFTWHINKLETLVYYNHSTTKGFPLIVRNDSLFLRDVDNCREMDPVKEEQLATIFSADGIHRYVYSINNQFPGPNIVVYEGQQVRVKVTNGLLQEGTTIHWHGMYQKHTNYMDGTGSVTQCPINPGETFTYRFIAEPAGTHWYHSHFGLQRTDGLGGALIVLPRNNTPTTQQAEHSLKFKPAGWDDIYNIEKSEDTTAPITTTTTATPPDPGVLPTFEKEFVFFVHDWFHEDSDDIFVSYYYEIVKFLWDGYNNTDECHERTQQLDGGEVGTIPFLSGLINGKGQYTGKYDKAIKVPMEKFKVKQGKYYRFRAINSGMNFAMKISMDQHRLHVISSDGMDLEEVVTDGLIVHGGERYDFYIKADKPVDTYLIRAETLESMQGRQRDWDFNKVSPGGAHAILQYHGAPVTNNPTSKKRNCTVDDKCVVVNCPFKEYPKELNGICVGFDKLKAKKPNKIAPTTGVEEHFLNFHFPFGIGGLLRSQVNGIQFQAPSTPPTVAHAATYDNICDMEKCDREPCHCAYQVNITHHNEVYMVLSSTVTDTEWEGLPATVHPVHLHGHHFQVVKVGYAQIDPDTKRYVKMNPDIQCTSSRCNHVEWTDPSWKHGNIPGINLHTPPLKDTVTVPVGGYVVIRFAADNPGWWIMHCHLELHQVEGMALIIQEGQPDEMTHPPKHFPTCGSFDWSDAEFEKKISGDGSHTLGSVMVVLGMLLLSAVLN